MAGYFRRRFCEKFFINCISNAIELGQSDLEDMIDEFITFFMAGQETTANTLAFCLIEITKSPCILGKLRDEIDSVLGDRNAITNEDLNKLEYVSCVIKETLRKWPPANLPMRQVNTNDFKINGISIPKGALLHVKINSKFSIYLFFI